MTVESVRPNDRHGRDWIRRLARAVVAIVVTGVIVLAVGYRMGPEKFWFFAAAQYLPYPVFLLPSIIALGLSLTLGWAWRLVAILGVVLVTTSVAGFQLNRGESGTRQLRVMTYNVKDYITIRGEDGLSEIARGIARHNPDIVVLQDARQVADSRDTLLSLLADRQAYAFGQYVIASRFPLRNCGQREIPFRQENHTYVTCIVAAGGTEFDLTTAHLITPRSGLSAARDDPFGGVAEWRENVSDRLVQANALARDVKLRTRPVIVAGDFNAPETSLVVRALLDTGLRDAFSVAGVGFGHTWGHSLRLRFSFLRIDYILVGPEFRVLDCFVGGALGSPHRPVIADLSLTPASAAGPSGQDR